MGETPDDLKREVENARARLGQDLNDLEFRVKSEFDWHYHFDRRPWAFLGAAFALAMLFGMATVRAAPRWPQPTDR